MIKEIFPVSTPKEIFLELIKPDGQPERQLCQYEALHMCLTDPSTPIFAETANAVP